MKINLEVNNTTESPVENNFFLAVAEETFAEVSLDFLEKKEIGISLALVAPEEIKKLNNEYRKYDSVTDILSFPEYGSTDELKKASQKEGGEVFLGELILCYDDIKEYSQKEKYPPVGGLEKELAKVVAHGILHLLGFEHGEKMFALQQSVADKFIK
jgi:probable rRNA maturation factor